MKERDELLSNIQDVDFNLIQLNLYLDNFPYDQQAIAELLQTKMLSEKLKAEFECNFGPLTPGTTDTSYWNWIDEPWPWERQQCGMRRQNCGC